MQFQNKGIVKLLYLSVRHIMPFELLYQI